MSIPKVIHYCWFGGNLKPELIQKCIASWRKFCPDWEIIEWNESNFDVNFCPYAEKAFKEKRWAFLTDAARLKIVYEHGGVYLDTDAELIRSIEPLMNGRAWFGYATATEIGTGLGFGAEPKHWFIQKLLDQYLKMSYDTDYDLCTRIDTLTFREYFPNFAGDQKIAQSYKGINIVNNIYAYEIHHYTGTWQTPLQRVESKVGAIMPGKLRDILKYVRRKIKCIKSIRRTRRK